MKVETWEDIQKLDIGFKQYETAVECVLFDRKGNWILMERGSGSRDEIGKLEGVGGALENGENPVSGLKRELAEEVGKDPEIEITDYIGYKELDESEQEGADKNWAVIMYLGLLKSGELHIMEPDKNRGFQYVKPGKVEPEKLSSSAKLTRQKLLQDNFWKESIR